MQFVYFLIYINLVVALYNTITVLTRRPVLCIPRKDNNVHTVIKALSVIILPAYVYTYVLCCRALDRNERNLDRLTRECALLGEEFFLLLPDHGKSRHKVVHARLYGTHKRKALFETDDRDMVKLPINSSRIFLTLNEANATLASIQNVMHYDNVDISTTNRRTEL